MKNKIKSVVYPVGGISNTINDITELFELYMNGKDKIVINTSAQPNSIPHMGSITRDIMNALKRNGVYIGVNWIFSKIYQKKMGFSNEYISERLLSNIETRSIKLIYYEEVEIKNDPNYDKCIIYVIKGGEKL